METRLRVASSLLGVSSPQRRQLPLSTRPLGLAQRRAETLAGQADRYVVPAVEFEQRLVARLAEVLGELLESANQQDENLPEVAVVRRAEPVSEQQVPASAGDEAARRQGARLARVELGRLARAAKSEPVADEAQRARHVLRQLRRQKVRVLSRPSHHGLSVRALKQAGEHLESSLASSEVREQQEIPASLRAQVCKPRT